MSTAVPPATPIGPPARTCWRTSSHSSGGGACVEVRTGTVTVHVRDTKDRGGPSLAFSPLAWARFLTALPDLPVPS